MSGSCRGDNVSNSWIERAGAITPGHFRERNDLDPGRIACGPELLEPLAAEVAHRVHRGLEKFPRVEFAFRLCGHLAEDGRHRQAAVGIDIDLAHAVLDAAPDL